MTMEDGAPPARPEEGEADSYPNAPGASKMEALRRIERGLEEQREQTPDRDESSDARKVDAPDDEGTAADDRTGDSPQ